MSASSNIRDNIVGVLQQSVAGLQAAYLYGSCSNGGYVEGSDVDIALLFEPAASPNRSVNLLLHPVYAELVLALGRDIDLINLRYADTLLQSEVLFQGECILCADALAREEFELRVMRAFQELNVLRESVKSDMLVAARKRSRV